jgi:hypothetical protein
MRYIFEGVYRDGNGKVVPSGTVSVYLAGTTTAADIYTTLTGATAVNSVTSSTTTGRFTFYVDDFDYDSDQTYDIVLSKSGYDSDTYYGQAPRPCLGNYIIDTALVPTTHIRHVPGVLYVHSAGGSIDFSGATFECGSYQAFSSFDAGDITGLTSARPEWWGGGTSASAANNTTAFACAIASMARPYIILSDGTYQHTGITAADYTRIVGQGRQNTKLDNTSTTSHSITITGLNSVQIEDLQLISTGSTTGYAIYGAKPASETQRYPKIKNIMTGGHKGGIYLNNPLDATIDDCYIGGQGKAVSGGIGIDLISGTTVTVSNTYVTGFEHDIETSTQGYVFNRIICETADKGIVSTVRGTLIEPYFSAIDTYDIDLATNGALVVGYVGSDVWPTKINWASETIRQRTSFLPSTHDLPAQLFGRRIFYGTAAPTTGTWSVGDIYFNTGAITPYGWSCIEAGTPGTWVELSNGLQYQKKMYQGATSGTGEDTLQTVSIPASTLGATPAYYGGGVKVTAWGRKTGSAGNKTIKLYFGATAFTVFPAANNTNDWKLEAFIMNAGTASSQKVHWTLTDSGTVTSDNTTAAIDTSAAVTLKITGEVADGADAITCEAWLVERF